MIELLPWFLAAFLGGVAVGFVATLIIRAAMRKHDRKMIERIATMDHANLHLTPMQRERMLREFTKRTTPFRPKIIVESTPRDAA